MKYKLTIAIVITVLLLTGGILEEIYVAKVFDELSEKVEKVLQTESETYDLKELEDIHDWWKGKHRYLELFLPHVQLNEIEITYGEMLGAVKADDYEGAKAQLNRIYATSKAINEMLSFRLGNIF